MLSLLVALCAASQLAMAAAQSPQNRNLTNHVTRFSFLSPGVDYSPPGEWSSGNLNGAYNQSGSISIGALTTGISFDLKADCVYFLINGTKADEMDKVKVETNETTTTIEGLTYGWYNFTAVTSGDAAFRGASLKPVTVLEPTIYNSTNFDELPITFDGNWTTDGRIGTSTPGSRLNITVPQHTTLLQLTADGPSGAYAPFRITVTPPPPRGPSNHTFEPSLSMNRIQALILHLNVLIYTVNLSPSEQYTIELEVLDDKTPWGTKAQFYFHNVWTFQSSLQNNTGVPFEG